MQQTETYKLNLIETGDAFSPLPLNENMEKVEAALGKVVQNTDEALDALSATVPQIVMGTYTGTGTRGSEAKTTITFGVNPKFALVWSASAYFGFFSRNHVSRVICGTGSSDTNAVWGDKAVTIWTAYADPAFQLNASGIEYTWLAIC